CAASIFVGEPESESGDGGPDWQVRAGEKGDACASRVGLAAGGKAVDRSDPGYNESASTGRECGRGKCATYGGRFAAIGRRSFTNCGARRAISRRTAEIGGTLNIGESCRKA